MTAPPIADTIIDFFARARARLGLPAPSLDQLAAGGFPRFSETKEDVAMLRSRGRALH